MTLLQLVTSGCVKAHIDRKVECAVIDEIQMIGDRERGWAWTRALLGIPAEEVHLCGNESALPLIQKLCEDTNEQLQVKEYQRLTPLVVSERYFRSPIQYSLN